MSFFLSHHFFFVMFKGHWRSVKDHFWLLDSLASDTHVEVAGALDLDYEMKNRENSISIFTNVP